MLYPIGEYKKGKFIFTSAIEQVKGDNKAILKYYHYLKNHKSVVKAEMQDNVISTLVKNKKTEKLYEAIYDPVLIYPSPAFLNEDGLEEWEIACWDRKPLEKIIEVMEKSKSVVKFEIVSFKQKNLQDIYLLKLLPELSEKQKSAIELAYKKGYYSYPKKTDLNKLSKLAGLGKSTFQEHLKKAEAKLIPYLIS